MIRSRTLARSALAVALAAITLSAAPALAGAPYQTDDPVPTDPGKWEIFAFTDNTFGHGDSEGEAGLDINYGIVDDLQLVVAASGEFQSDDDRDLSLGDVELGLKYRFLNDEAHGLQAAVYPTLIVPTGRGGGRAAYALPVWLQQDFGPWSLFGGGGVTIQPGAGRRDFWEGGVALTRSLGEDASLGIEIFHGGSEERGERGATTLGIGGTVKLAGPFSLVGSAGPVIEDGTGRTGAHAYLALLSNF